MKQKITLTDEEIKEIAGNLEIGNVTHYNVVTGEIVSHPDPDRYFDDLEDLWGDILEKIEENSDDFIEFGTLESYESYKIMEDFTETVEDPDLKKALEKALSRPKPFQNFKYEIDGTIEERKQWFAFKSACYVESVKDQLRAFNRQF